MPEYENFAKGCFRGYPPPCSWACPFHMDVRSFVSKMQAGSITAAYRIYRDSVVFPAVVSELCGGKCKGSCVRGESSVDLSLLERACVKNAGDKKPIRYSAPAKTAKAAIVGAGISGLACALRLLSRGYETTVFEASREIGGRLKSIPETIWKPDIENEFQYYDLNILFSNEIKDPRTLLDRYDAVYVCAGEKSGGFGFASVDPAGSLAAGIAGVFMGGAAIGSDIVESIENGVRAAASMENYIMTGSMAGIGETFARPAADRRFYQLEYRTRNIDGLRAVCGEDPVLHEAGKCYCCDCSECMDRCGMMKWYKKYPKRLCTDIAATLKPIEQFSKRVGFRMVNSCNVCGLCGEVCPAGIDMGECILNARRYLHDDGHMPPALHEFWLEDMKFSMSGEAGFLYRKDPDKPCGVLFFPGCQLSASLPEAVARAYEAISERYPNAGLWASCCGVPAEWAGDTALRNEAAGILRQEWESAGKPEVIFACMTCKKIFETYFEGMEAVSLYEWLCGHDKNTERGDAGNENVHIFDPCAARNDTKAQQAVRRLLGNRGFNTGEEENGTDRDQIVCCGFGGHIYIPNRKLTQAIVDKNSSRSGGKYVVYCANCRDLFLDNGKDCRHILELLFDVECKVQPDLSDRRKNRKALKAKYCGQNTTGNERRSNISIPEDAALKMKKNLIMREDAERVIRYCEETGNKLIDGSAGLMCGHLSRGAMTYWVHYKYADGGFEVVNAYSHRMRIKGE